MFPWNLPNSPKIIDYKIDFLTRNEYNSFDPVQLYLRPMVDQEFPSLFHLSYFHEFDPNIELYAEIGLTISDPLVRLYRGDSMILTFDVPQLASNVISLASRGASNVKKWFHGRSNNPDFVVYLCNDSVGD